MTEASKPIHVSFCALHNGPAMIPGPCSCGADPGMDPIRYGSEFPKSVYDAAPDMLAALDGILEDDAHTTPLADQRARWNDRMEAARAAVAKAKSRAIG